MLPMENTPRPAGSALEEESASQEAALQAVAQRERELRQSLIEARDALLRRDEEIDRLQGELADVRDEPTNMKRLRSKLEARDRKLLEQNMRIRRLEQSLPMRARARLAQLPVGRRISARRQKAFQEEVNAATEGRRQEQRGSRPT